jgi:hypothetical protein
MTYFSCNTLTVCDVNSELIIEKSEQIHHLQISMITFKPIMIKSLIITVIILMKMMIMLVMMTEIVKLWMMMIVMIMILMVMIMKNINCVFGLMSRAWGYLPISMVILSERSQVRAVAV